MIELVDEGLADSMQCDQCGSHFHVLASRAERSESAIPRQLGHFQLKSKLGHGAFGTVWSARDTELDRTVALKIPRRGQLDPQEAEMFLREARMAAQLKHPHIVTVHEVGCDGPTLYIVSDLVEGETLSDWAAGRQLAYPETVQLVVKLARALEHAHSRGVIHRDLKPSNIMIDRAGEPHLMDFGLAKRDAGEITMTLDGQILGTPAYMSPEQARGDGHRAEAASDVYSLGVVLFELLAGELPFRGNTRMLIQQVVNDEPPSPRKFDAHVPRDLETICLKCLEKDPSRRFASAGDLADELERYARHEPIHSRPLGRRERFKRWCRRNPRVARLTAAMAVSAVLGCLLAVVAVGAARRAYFSAREAEWNQYVGAILLANRELNSQRPQQSNAALDSVAANLRDWEWRYLKRASGGSAQHYSLPEGEYEFVGRNQLASRDRRDDQRYQLALPNGPQPISEPTPWVVEKASLPLRLRHKRTKQALRFDGVHHATFSADGRYLAMQRNRGEESTLALVDLADGKQIAEYGTRVSAWAFADDRPTLAVGDGTHYLIVELPSRRVVRHLQNMASSTQMRFSPNGGKLVVVNQFDTVTVVDVEKGTQDSAFESPVQNLAMDPSGKWIATLNRDGSIGVWNVETRTREHAFAGDTAITDLRMLDSSHVATVRKRTIQIWSRAQAKTPVEVATRSHGTSFSPSGRFLFVETRGKIQAWDAVAGRFVDSLKASRRPVMSPAETRAVLLQQNANEKTVQVVDLDRNETLLTVPDVAEYFFADEQYLIGIGPASEAAVYDLDARALVYSTVGFEARLPRVTSRPRPAADDEPSDARPLGWIIVSPDDGRELGFEPVGDGNVFDMTHRLVRSMNALYCALVYVRDESICCSVWRLDRPERVAQMRIAPRNAMSRWFSEPIELSSQAEFIRLGGEVRDLKSGEVVIDDLVTARFSPSGPRIAVAKKDGTVQEWDLKQQRSIRAFALRGAAVHDLAYSPDGQEIAILDSKKRISIFATDGPAARRVIQLESAWDRIAYSATKEILLIGSKRLGVCNSTGETLRTFRPQSGALRHGKGTSEQPPSQILWYDAQRRAIELLKPGFRRTDGRAGNVLRELDAVHPADRLGQIELAEDLAQAHAIPGTNRIVTLESDGALRVWDLKTMQEMLILREPTGKKETSRSTGFDRTKILSRNSVVGPGEGSLRLSPDGNRLCLHLADGPVLLYDATLD